MANEITVIGSKTLQEGTVEWSLFYWLDLSADPVVDSGGSKVVVENSARVPASIKPFLDQATQIDPIDSGDAAFLVRTIRQTPGETTSAFLSRVQVDYASVKTWWVNERKDEVGNRGVQRNA